jgi:hypothetical protein
MMPWPSWTKVLEQLHPYGISLKQVNLSGLPEETGCYLVREDPEKSTSLGVDLSPNHELSHKKVSPDQLKNICRRFDLDPSILDVGLD